MDFESWKQNGIRSFHRGYGLLLVTKCALMSWIDVNLGRAGGKLASLGSCWMLNAMHGRSQSLEVEMDMFLSSRVQCQAN